MQRNPVAFGLDYIEVHGNQPVRIMAVRLLGVSGGLKLVNVSFVPGGSVGGGMRYDSNREASVPKAWRARVSMPGAVLRPLRPSAKEMKAMPSADEWQVVVGVIATSDKGTARGVEVDYKDGVQTKTLKGRWAVGLSRGSIECAPVDQ